MTSSNPTTAVDYAELHPLDCAGCARRIKPNHDHLLFPDAGNVILCADCGANDRRRTIFRCTGQPVTLDRSSAWEHLRGRTNHREP